MQEDLSDLRLQVEIEAQEMIREASRTLGAKRNRDDRQFQTEWRASIMISVPSGCDLRAEIERKDPEDARLM